MKLSEADNALGKVTDNHAHLKGSHNQWVITESKHLMA